MNIRLDSKSIRIRLLVDEAKFLYSKGFITEKLPFFNHWIEFKISLSDKIDFDYDLKNHKLEFFFKKSVLESLLDSLTDSALEYSTLKQIKGQEGQLAEFQLVEIRFEIDRHDYKRKEKKS